MSAVIHPGLNPDRPYRAPRAPQTLAVDVEQREVFLPATGLLSYRIHLVYTDEGNWSWERFDLLEEVQAVGERLRYRPVDLSTYRTDRVTIAAGLQALIVTDISHSDVMQQVEDEIVADMRRLDEIAADHAADDAIEDRWIARRGVAA
jgi:hypothetical protein